MFREERLVGEFLFSFGLISKLGGADEVPEFDYFLDQEIDKD
jgi:hypothetical protein